MAHQHLRVTSPRGGTGTSTLPQALARALREAQPPAPPTAQEPQG